MSAVPHSFCDLLKIRHVKSSTSWVSLSVLLTHVVYDRDRYHVGFWYPKPAFEEGKKGDS